MDAPQVTATRNLPSMVRSFFRFDEALPSTWGLIMVSYLSLTSDEVEAKDLYTLHECAVSHPPLIVFY